MLAVWLPALDRNARGRISRPSAAMPSASEDAQTTSSSSGSAASTKAGVENE